MNNSLIYKFNLFVYRIQMFRVNYTDNLIVVLSIKTAIAEIVFLHTSYKTTR